MPVEETQYFEELPDNLSTQFQLPGQKAAAAQPQKGRTDDQGLQNEEASVPINWKKGDVILGIYEVLGTLGGGGFGVVYKVHHRGWNVDMAVKSPKPEALKAAGGVGAVVQEAETWMDLGMHPNIVTCHYVRVLGGIPRVFAEFIEGGSLLDWIEKGSFSDLPQMLDVLIQFARGLDYAHHRGLVHRDVKPANVMMTSAGAARVTDFGLAQAKSGDSIQIADSGGQSVEVSNAFLTPAYCSPEQAEAGALFQQGIDSSQWPDLSQATDVWSWAISVLHMFIGECTWKSGLAGPTVLDRYLQGDMETGSIPRMPDALGDLLKKCLVIDPAQRLSDFGKIAVDLIDIYQQAAGFSYSRENPRQLKLRANALNNHALSMVDLGHPETARELWNEALRVLSDHFESLYNLAMLDWRSGKIDDLKVMQKFKNWLAEKPDDWRRAYLAACIQAERLNFSQARSLLAPLLSNDPEQSELKSLEKALSDDQMLDFTIKNEFAPPKDIEAYAKSIHYLDYLDVDAEHTIAATILISKAKIFEVKIWDLKSKQYIQTITNMDANRNFNGVELIMPLGAVLVDGRTNYGEGCHFYNIASGKFIGIIPFLKDGGNYSLSPNKQFLITDGAEPTLWDLQPLKIGKAPRLLQKLPLVLYDPAINDTATHAMGIYRTTAKAGVMLIYYDLKSQQIQTSKELATGVIASHFCADGIHAFTLGRLDNKLRFDADHSPTDLFSTTLLEHWNLQTGQIKKSVQAQICEDNLFERIKFSPEHGIGITTLKNPFEGFAFAPTNLIHAWDLNTGKVLSSFIAGKSSVTSMDIHHNLLALGYKDGNIKFVDLSAVRAKYSAPLEYSRLQTIDRTQEDLKQYAALMDQAKAAIKEKDTITAVRALKQVRELPGYEKDERTFSLWQNMYLRQPKIAFKSAIFYRLYTEHPYKQIKLDDNELGRLAAITMGGLKNLREGYRSVYLLDGKTEETLDEIKLKKFEYIHSFDIDFNKGEVLLGGTLGAIIIWSLKKGKKIKQYKIQGDYRQPQVLFSPDGQFLLIASMFASIQVINRKDGRVLSSMKGKERSMHISFAVNRSGTKLLLGRGKDHNAVMVDLTATGWVGLAVIDVSSLCFSPDDSIVYVGSRDGKVISFNLDPQGGKKIGEHQGAVNALALSSDGHFLFSGCADGSACIWDIAHKQKVWEFFTPRTNAVTDVGFTRDGRYGYVVAEDIHVWQLDWELGEEPPADWHPSALVHLKNFLSPRFRDKHAKDAIIVQQKKPKLDEGTITDAQQYLAECSFGYLTREGITEQIQAFLSTLKR